MKFINRKFIWLVLSLIVFSFQSNAQAKDFDESVLSQNGKQAYQTLLKIETFAIGGVGYSGTMSKGEEAFNILIDEKEANSAFKNMIKTATVEGALCSVFGLYVNNCDCYKENLNDFMTSRILNNDSEKFSTQAGCSGYEATKSSDKKFVIEYILKEFGGLTTGTDRLREKRKLEN